MRKGFLAVLATALALMVTPVLAQDTPGTIAEIVVASATGETPEFATLLTAVQAADPAVLEALSNPEAQLTVFAPTDAAFAALAEALGEEAFGAVLADPAALTDILLYHVTQDVYGSELVVAALDLADASYEAWGMPAPVASLETLNGQSIDVTRDDMGIYIDDAMLNLEMVDIVASNGVIHVIDAVLLPEARTIAEIVVETAGMTEAPEFTTLLTAVGAADPSVLELLSDPEAELTVFAPTDAAFAALSEALGAETFGAIVADPAALTPILTYHVLADRVSSTDLAQYATGMMMMDSTMEAPAWLGGVEEGVVTLNTANGGTLTFAVDMENGLLLNDTIKIIMNDIDAANGTIHVINAVLVPPSN
jgi:transforming growth factor-beta-induced protein